MCDRMRASPLCDVPGVLACQGTGLSQHVAGLIGASGLAGAPEIPFSSPKWPTSEEVARSVSQLDGKYPTLGFRAPCLQVYRRLHGSDIPRGKGVCGRDHPIETRQNRNGWLLGLPIDGAMHDAIDRRHRRAACFPLVNRGYGSITSIEKWARAAACRQRAIQNRRPPCRVALSVQQCR